MERLIREEDVLKVIRNGWSNHESCKEMCDEITCLPAAFDVEAVLNKLEVLYNLVNPNQELAVLQAIDIVRNGGVKC